MDKFTKITIGFVAQAFGKNDKGQFVCTRQEFIAGDQCDYEDAEGNPIEPPDYEYQPYNMTLESKGIEEAIEAEAAGEDQIDQLKRRHQIVQQLRVLAVKSHGLTASLPTLPIARWLDGTIEDATKDVYFEDYDLAKLLRFIADVGVSYED